MDLKASRNRYGGTDEIIPKKKGKYHAVVIRRVCTSK